MALNAQCFTSNEILKWNFMHLQFTQTVERKILHIHIYITCVIGESNRVQFHSSESEQIPIITTLAKYKSNFM